MSASSSLHPSVTKNLIREIAGRGVLVIGLFGIALIHLLDSIGKYHEVRYIFWMYIGLILSSITLAIVLLHRSSSLDFLATAGLAASVLVGFIINRTVGMPHATDDIGNWTEPLGLASLFVEGAVLVVSLYLFTFLKKQPA